MTERFCFDCNFKNKSNDNFCQECGAPLDFSDYIESKKISKTFIDKVKSFFGNKHIDEINSEIEDLINLSIIFTDFEEDLENFRSINFDEDKFLDKYGKIVKLDDFKYLDEINKDKYLNKKVLLLKKAKTVIENFDDEIKYQKELVNDINLNMEDINSFYKEYDDLAYSKPFLKRELVNSLSDKYASTFNFFNELSLKKADNDSKIISVFLSDYTNLNKIKNGDKGIRPRVLKDLLHLRNDEIDRFNQEINSFKNSDSIISDLQRNDIKEKYGNLYDLAKEVNAKFYLKDRFKNFINDFDNLDQIIDDFNAEIHVKVLENELYSREYEVNQFFDEIESLKNSNFYITDLQYNILKEDYKDLYALAKEVNANSGLKSEFEEFLKFYRFLWQKIKSFNTKFIKKELNEHKDFFDNIDGKSLDDKQRLAVVTDEQNSQIIAGAGCGKTLTVNAKVRYLIEKKGIKPEEILCLSYSKSSVGDLIEKLPEGIEIKTFHKLGGEILKYNNKPSRTDDNILTNFIREYFSKNLINEDKFSKDILEFFSYYFYNPVGDDEATVLGEVFDIEEAKDFKTLKQLYGKDKEKNDFKNIPVKSLEELIISNYLFVHQIDYEYEKVFDCDNAYFYQQREFVFNLIFGNLNEVKNYSVIPDILVDDMLDLCKIEKHVVIYTYKPDFYLKKNNIYLEHFGVDRNCEAKWLDEKNSAKYKEDMMWKRELHKKYGSNLIETYSYYTSENRLLTRLEEKLEQAGVEIKEIDYQHILSVILKNRKVNKYNKFIELIKTFIELFKGNNYELNKFEEWKTLNRQNDDEFDKKRTDIFLSIVEDIYVGYENHLKDNRMIDFNDMINNATSEVNKGNLENFYKYIIVDEYQDISYTRYNLIKSIQNKTGAKICVVGDDWQSIYRFSGCDVDLFTNFEKFFKNPKKMRIETTYRNSQKLIDISGRFIMENPNQIDKSLNSMKDLIHKPVKIAYYDNSSKENKIKLMETLIDKISQESNNIMILGRHKFDIADYIDEGLFEGDYKNNSKLNYTKNKDLNINFSSVHKSKGLEEDNVIVINLENGIFGFPNQMSDDPLMRYVIKKSDQFKYAEERRLFYVALTRTKNNVYLMSPIDSKSPFIEELEKNIHDLDVLPYENFTQINFENINEFMKDKRSYSIRTELKCPVCKTGSVNLILFNNGSNKISKFFVCSHKQCRWDGGGYYAEMGFLDEIEICPECGKVMQVYFGKYGPYYRCSGKCKTSKIKKDKLKRILSIVDETHEKEIHESDLFCPKCGNGKVTLNIDSKYKFQYFACSDNNCDWDGGLTNIDKNDLDKIRHCLVCDGIMVLKNGKKGKFYGCNNYPKCDYAENINNDSNVTLIKTHLKCPKCNNGNIILEKYENSNESNFKCLKCNWDGGIFKGNSEKLESIDYCSNEGCDGIVYFRDEKNGENKYCSNHFRTGCNGN